ncbi:hypothetical protein FJTKL_01957 [Diaporthe vaccinii]|uniref:Uncharacterized protein n=1 Tax=Diaporthe vaccinii TaxID=105482 RepID=A0ABR4DZI0_9PEZI
MLTLEEWCGADAYVPVCIPLHPFCNSIPCNSKHCTVSNRLNPSRNSIPAAQTCTLHIPPTTRGIRTIVMEKQAEHKLLSGAKSVAHIGWKEGLLPNINKVIAEVTRVGIVVIMQTGAQVTVGKVEYNWEKIAIEFGPMRLVCHTQTC